MASEWKRTSLREAGVTLIDCDHRTPPAADSGYPYVAIPQLKEGRLSLGDVRRISPEHFAEWTRKAKPQHHDVILSRRCNPGETAYVPSGLECALGQNLVLLRADGKKLFPPFLRWLVRGTDWWEQVGTFINVGAVFDSLKCADIPNFSMPLPPLADQKAIAALLGALDDKIELNRRMNATLEAMARALFQSWFVDFDPVRRNMDRTQRHGDTEVRSRSNDLRASVPPCESFDPFFPGSFQDSELGPIPFDWEVSKLKDLTSKIGSGATPRGGSEVYVDEGPALIRSQNVYDHEFHWAGLARLTEKSASELKNVEVMKDDVLLNITGDSILRTCVVDRTVLPARVNQHVAIIRAIKGIPPRYLHLYLVQDSIKSLLIGMSAGATRHAITKGHLESTDVLKPSTQVLATFEKLTSPWFEQIHANRIQSRTLATLRDTLLPKLLSGELSVASLPVARGAAENAERKNK
jgi:type I restriction enzyme, S subunit